MTTTPAQTVLFLDGPLVGQTKELTTRSHFHGTTHYQIHILGNQSFGICESSCATAAIMNFYKTMYKINPNLAAQLAQQDHIEKRGPKVRDQEETAEQNYARFLDQYKGFRNVETFKAHLSAMHVDTHRARYQNGMYSETASRIMQYLRDRDAGTKTYVYEINSGALKAAQLYCATNTINEPDYYMGIPLSDDSDPANECSKILKEEINKEILAKISEQQNKSAWDKQIEKELNEGIDTWGRISNQFKGKK